MHGVKAFGLRSPRRLDPGVCHSRLSGSLVTDPRAVGGSGPLPAFFGARHISLV